MKVWSNPISHLAETHGIPDHELRKLCREFNIPVPQNGYWQKLSYNKPLSKIPLAPVTDEDKKITLRANAYDNEERISPSAQSGIENNLNDPKAPAKVPDVLTKPHFLTLQTKRHWADFNLKRQI